MSPRPGKARGYRDVPPFFFELDLSVPVIHVARKTRDLLGHLTHQIGLAAVWIVLPRRFIMVHHRPGPIAVAQVGDSAHNSFPLNFSPKDRQVSYSA